MENKYGDKTVELTDKKKGREQNEHENDLKKKINNNLYLLRRRSGIICISIEEIDATQKKQ